MDERYKALIDRNTVERQIKRRCGTLGRKAVGNRNEGVRGKDDLFVSLSTSNGKRGVKHSICMRLKGEFADAYNLKIGDFVKVDYDNSPEGCIFVMKRACPKTGVMFYKTSQESGIRTAFTPEEEDLQNLFSDTKRYWCELKHVDDATGVMVFEELK